MKLALLLCALLLSAQAWCSSGPVYHTGRLVYSGNHGVTTTYSQDAAERNPQMGGMKTALSLCGCIFYMVSILWWTRSAKRRLDNTLEGVMECIAEIDIYRDVAASGTSSRL